MKREFDDVHGSAVSRHRRGNDPLRRRRDHRPGQRASVRDWLLRLASCGHRKLERRQELRRGGAMNGESPMAPASTHGGKRKLWLVVAAEMIALGAAIAVAITFDLGWIGGILIVALVAVFTVMIVRAGESRARSLGNFSAAMGRY